MSTISFLELRIFASCVERRRREMMSCVMTAGQDVATVTTKPHHLMEASARSARRVGARLMDKLCVRSALRGVVVDQPPNSR